MASSSFSFNLSDTMSGLKLLVRRFCLEDIDSVLEENTIELYDILHELHHYPLDAITIKTHLTQFNELMDFFNEQKSTSSELNKIVMLANQIMTAIKPSLDYPQRMETLELLSIAGRFQFNATYIKNDFTHIFGCFLALMDSTVAAFSDLLKRVDRIALEPSSSSKTVGESKQWLSENIENLKSSITSDSKDFRQRVDVIRNSFEGRSVLTWDNVEIAYRQFFNLYTLINEDLTILEKTKDGKKTVELIENVIRNLLLTRDSLKFFDKLGVIKIDIRSLDKANKIWRGLVKFPLSIDNFVHQQFVEFMKTPAGPYVYQARQPYVKPYSEEAVSSKNSLPHFLNDPAISSEMKINARIHWENMKRASELEVLAMLLPEKEFKVFEQEFKNNLSRALLLQVEYKAKEVPPPSDSSSPVLPYADEKKVERKSPKR